MPKNILIDLNVILDVLLERRGFEASRDVLSLGELGSHRLYTSAHVVTTFAYLLENAKVPRPEILRHVDWLLRTFSVVPVDGALLKLALKSRVVDYEDAVIECAADQARAAAIVTRNTKDFKMSRIKAMAPEVYLGTLSEQKSP